MTLRDLAALCDIFYIGGTKCGALLGEAVVIPQPGLIPHFFTIIKQHGALLAKGRLLGIQFDTLFTDGLYERIGKDAVRYADAIRRAMVENGYCPVSPPRRTRASASSVSSSAKSSPSAWTSPSGSNMTRRTASSALPQAGRRGKRM